MVEWQIILGTGNRIHSFPSTFSTNVPVLLLNQPTISTGWKVQYIYSVNEVCGNDQPKKDTFSGLRFMWTKGRDFTSLGVAKYMENCHLGMKRVFQCLSKSCT